MKQFFVDTEIHIFY